jgi:hypothetical protein
VGVAALSYNGQLTIGILTDPVACPDVEVLAEGVGHCFSELVAAVPSPGRAAHHAARA